MKAMQGIKKTGVILLMCIFIQAMVFTGCTSDNLQADSIASSVVQASQVPVDSAVNPTASPVPSPSVVSTPDGMAVTPVSVKSVAIGKSSIRIHTGETVQLNAAVSPKNAAESSLSWSSTDQHTATVNNGAVTGIAAGVCTIRATAINGVFSACKVTVATQKPVKIPTATDTPAKQEGFLGAAFKHSSQVILVTASKMNTIYANLSTFEKVKGVWTKKMDVKARIGKKGMVNDAERIEGDLKTPAGIYKIPYAFGTASNPGTKMPFMPIDANTYFDGMYGSKTYGRLVEGKPDNNEWEYMNIAPYQYGALINFNAEEKAGKGNAIFLHEFTRSGYTAGCVSISPDNLVSVLRWLNPDKNPLIVICPKSRLSDYYS